DVADREQKWTGRQKIRPPRLAQPRRRESVVDDAEWLVAEVKMVADLLGGKVRDGGNRLSATDAALYLSQTAGNIRRRPFVQEVQVVDCQQHRRREAERPVFGILMRHVPQTARLFESYRNGPGPQPADDGFFPPGTG